MGRKCAVVNYYITELLLKWNHMGRRCWQLPGQVFQARAVAVIGVEHFRACFISENDNRSCGTGRKFLWSAVHLCFFSLFRLLYNHSHSLCAQVQCYELAIPPELAPATQATVLASVHLFPQGRLLCTLWSFPVVCSFFLVPKVSLCVMKCKELWQVTSTCSWNWVWKEQMWDL